MAENSGQEKTEEATPKKREESREEGQVAKSMEIASVLVLLIGVSVLYLIAYFVYGNLAAIMRHQLTFSRIPEFDVRFCTDMLFTLSLRIFVILLPVMGAILLTALVANFAQVGFQLTPKAIMPKLDKLDIIKGFGRIVGKRALVEMVKSIFKILIIAGVSYYAIKGEIDTIFKLYDMSVGSILLYILKSCFKIFIWVILVMVAIAFLDYLYQRWEYEEQIKMTKQEVKDEYKQTEGDPMVKSRIRSIQAQTARKRMMAEVPEADVVVTNPTHLAIAIKYDPTVMRAPKVLAKGAGRVAERIREIATQNHIPIIENKQLARNLYKIVDIDDEIPADFFMAVAELLAYVYKLKGKKL